MKCNNQPPGPVNPSPASREKEMIEEYPGTRKGGFVCLWGITMLIWRSDGIKSGPLGGAGGGRWPWRLTKYSGVAPSGIFRTRCCCGPLTVIRLMNLLSHHSCPTLGEAPAHALPQWRQSGGGQPTYRPTQWRNARTAERVWGALMGGSGRRDATGQRCIKGGAQECCSNTRWGGLAQSV